MQNQFEVPELTLIGEASKVVLGTGMGGNDLPWESALDFEFEQD
jgi:hypothetical protein